MRLDIAHTSRQLRDIFSFHHFTIADHSKARDNEEKPLVFGPPPHPTPIDIALEGENVLLSTEETESPSHKNSKNKLSHTTNGQNTELSDSQPSGIQRIAGESLDEWMFPVDSQSAIVHPWIIPHPKMVFSILPQDTSVEAEKNCR